MSTYSPADAKAQWFARAFPGSKLVVNCGVIHTTETTDWPGYEGGAKAPNYTAKPENKRLVWRAHFPDEMSSRALKNLGGGVETNTANAVQVELVGTCSPATRDNWKKKGLKQDQDFVFWPEAPEWALQGLAEFVADMNRRHGIKIQGPAKWQAYPASFGQGNPNRMTFAQWRKFYGWCGHQHVPENDHGDPGALPWARVEKLARDIVTPPPVPVTVSFEIIATMNALGAHLAPGKLHPNMATGPVRIRSARKKLNAAKVTVCALQEFESPQASVIEASRYWLLVRATPNNTLKNGTTAGNGLMFRKDVWTCLSSHSVNVKISKGRTLHLPFVSLLHIKTGQTICFIVVHAPASKGGTPADRAAVKAAALNAASAVTGPVVILGDFNEARGVALAGFTVASHTGPDWIFTRGLVADKPLVDASFKGAITDHKVPSVRLTLAKK